MYSPTEWILVVHSFEHVRNRNPTRPLDSNILFRSLLDNYPTNMWNLYNLTRSALSDSNAAIQWCQERFLLPTTKTCPQCKSPMKFELMTRGPGRFRCNQNKKHRNKTEICIQLFSDTLFESESMPIEKTLILTYAFAAEMSYRQAIRESSLQDETTSDATIARRYAECREVCITALELRKLSDGKIGGEGRVVEIDECKIGRRKFNKERIVDGSWILGMIDLDGGYRLEICPDNKRDKTTLRDLITKNVADGSTIMTDCWKGYEGLNDIGIQQLTVNHSYHYVDPDTWANTQTIESTWRPLRRRLSRGRITKDKMASHPCEFMWRKDIKENNQDPFEVLIQDIRNIYTIN